MAQPDLDQLLLLATEPDSQNVQGWGKRFTTTGVQVLCSQNPNIVLCETKLVTIVA